MAFEIALKRAEERKADPSLSFWKVGLCREKLFVWSR